MVLVGYSIYSFAYVTTVYAEIGPLSTTFHVLTTISSHITYMYMFLLLGIEINKIQIYHCVDQPIRTNIKILGDEHFVLMEFKE